MGSIKMRFVVGKLSSDELEVLKRGEAVISKLLLVPDDYKIFHYKVGDAIEAETYEGNRIWTIIRSMEVIEGEMQVIVILTLVNRSE